MACLPPSAPASVRLSGLCALLLALCGVLLAAESADAATRDHRAIARDMAALQHDLMPVARFRTARAFRGGGMRMRYGVPARFHGFRPTTYRWSAPGRLVAPPYGYGAPYGYSAPVWRTQYGGRWGGWRGQRRGGRQGIAPPEAMRELRRQGYSNIDPLTRRGRNYVGEATGPRGGRQRVIIDMGSGQVTGSSRSGPPEAPMPYPGSGWYGGY